MTSCRVLFPTLPAANKKGNYEILHQPVYAYENRIIYKARPGVERRKTPIPLTIYKHYHPEATVFCSQTELSSSSRTGTLRSRGVPAAEARSGIPWRPSN